MGRVKRWMNDLLIKEALWYVDRNPMGNISKILRVADRLVKLEDHRKVLKAFYEIAENPDNNWHQLMKRVFSEVNPKTRRLLIRNFFFNSAMTASPEKIELRKKYQCNIPWAILMDPTSACNLKCTGCWASEYDKQSSLTYEQLDDIIRQGKELAIYMYIYSGGEPTLRKKDIIALAEKHQDCFFLAFTNATLIDRDYARRLARVGNFALAISVEGFEKETDMRRGEGTYQKVMEAMDHLREEGVGFGFSTCYHRYNTEVVVSDAFVDHLIDKGCMFGWYFTYMPIGKEAKLDFLVTPEQRKYMYHRIRELRAEKPCFLIDFWNDGEFVDGCIAGGRCYLHINAAGDVEPCAFIHYSNVNIRDVSLLEALQSPLFQQYRQKQPFNQNHLRPCPCLDNPDRLKEMVLEAGARSTQAGDGEPVEELTDKCREAARKWAAVADELWRESQRQKEEKEKQRIVS
ncbi:MAG: radical SAM protein [Bacillota bacterium]|jgi:MoaA/NifB/PqqE/SkfB family radical SAM enzyme